MAGLGRIEQACGCPLGSQCRHTAKPLRSLSQIRRMVVQNPQALLDALALADALAAAVGTLVDHTLSCQACGAASFCSIGMALIREIVHDAGKYRVARP